MEGVDRAGELHRAVGVEQADAGIEIDITVDDVITAPAFHHIGAAAAEDDVAAAEAGGTPQQRGKPADHGDAGRIEYVVHLGERIGQQATLEGVVAIPSGEALHLHEAIEQIDGNVGRQEKVNLQVGVDDFRGVGVGDPVKAPGSPALVDAGGAEHDVVARLGVVVIVAITNQHVVADQGAGTERVAVVALQKVGALAAFDPVVAGVTEDRVGPGAGEDKVVAQAGKGFGIAHPTEDHV